MEFVAAENFEVGEQVVCPTLRMDEPRMRRATARDFHLTKFVSIRKVAAGTKLRLLPHSSAVVPVVDRPGS